MSQFFLISALKLFTNLSQIAFIRLPGFDKFAHAQVRRVYREIENHLEAYPEETVPVVWNELLRLDDAYFGERSQATLVSALLAFQFVFVLPLIRHPELNKLALFFARCLCNSTPLYIFDRYYRFLIFY